MKILNFTAKLIDPGLVVQKPVSANLGLNLLTYRVKF
jgi:hypothetical protein